MSPLYLYNGKLLIENGALASSINCCCSGCNGVKYALSWETEGSGGPGIVPNSVRTITVPERYSLPVTVQFTTPLDDGLVINGERISNFGVVPPAFCMDERTFEAAVYNEDSTLWSVDGEFCFTEGCGDDRCCVTVTQMRCCYTATVPADEFNEEYSYTESLELQYINAEEQAEVEATCDALGGTLSMYFQGKRCLTIPPEECTASGGEPCSETCPPSGPGGQGCPTAPGFFPVILDCGGCTYEQALGGVNYALSLTPEEAAAVFNCPPPYSITAYGPFEWIGSSPCNEIWNFYAACVDCRPPTTCECVDWCCVRPGLLIDGNELPFVTSQEHLDGPQPCQCTFPTLACGFGIQSLSFTLPNQEDPSRLVAGVLGLVCENDISSVQLQFFSFGGNGAFTTFIWSGTAPITFDCNGGPLSVGEWTVTYCSGEDNMPVDPALEPELCAPPATVVFNGTFPCNPLP